MHVLPADHRMDATAIGREVLHFNVFSFGQPDPMRATQPRKPTTDLSGAWSEVVTRKGPPSALNGRVRATNTFKQRDSILDGAVTYQGGSGRTFTGVMDDKAVT